MKEKNKNVYLKEPNAESRIDKQTGASIDHEIQGENIKAESKIRRIGDELLFTLDIRVALLSDLEKMENDCENRCDGIVMLRRMEYDGAISHEEKLKSTLVKIIRKYWNNIELRSLIDEYMCLYAILDGIYSGVVFEPGGLLEKTDKVHNGANGIKPFSENG